MGEYLGTGKKKHGSRLRIIPLGGQELIGMNITVFEYEDSIIVVDCGLAFPDDAMLGIDLVIPDITYLKENVEKVAAFIITHGHEDHIGALPYVLKEVNAPIFATRLTMGLIEHRLQEHDLMDTTTRKVMKFGEAIECKHFSVEFIKTNHSIVDAAALAIHTPVGVIVHTGDFKVDYTPVYGDAIDLQRLAELGRKGVLALMCDSTNAGLPGFTQSERTVGRTFDQIFEEHKDTRILIATFASNVDRVQQIINTAEKYNRKVVIEGRSMVNTIEIATKLNCLQIADNILIDIDQLKDYPDERTVIITTGSQGESMAALSRMAGNAHRRISIGPNDTIIFSSHPVPGNEKAVTNVINDLLRKGADVIFQDVHVSGHACQEEIKLIYTVLTPRFAIPIHGEYKHLIAQTKVLRQIGFEKENIFVLQSGDVLELTTEEAWCDEKVTAGTVFVDGLGVGDVGNTVLRDRRILSEDGIIIVTAVMDEMDGRVLIGPDIVTRGFVYVRESDALLDEIRDVVREIMQDCEEKSISDWNRINVRIREKLSEFVWVKTKRRPMILPIFMNL
ncbi:MAG: ribonuclease J [Lachnospiraceae bacterium]|jgi:ribonuclease J|nr:ribonuclease J [Lachnospiraceae bacterium]